MITFITSISQKNKDNFHTNRANIFLLIYHKQSNYAAISQVINEVGKATTYPSLANFS